MKRAAILGALLLTGAAPFLPFEQARIDDRPGAQVPLDMPFVDQRGQATTLRRIAQGKPLLLVPVLHDCPNICDATLAGLGEAIARQRFRVGRDVAVVAFGIDPRETPGEASRNLRRHRLTQFSALVGGRPSIRAVTQALGYRYAWDARIGQYAHLSAVAVLTPEGRLSRWIGGIAPQPGQVERAIADARGSRTVGLGDALALLCYHYDPVSGRYSLAIDRIVKAAALLSVVALAALVWRLGRST